MLNGAAGGSDGDVVGLRGMAEKAVSGAATSQACRSNGTSKQNEHQEEVPSCRTPISTHPCGSRQWQQEQSQSNGCGISLKLVHANDRGRLNAKADRGWTSVGRNRSRSEGYGCTWRQSSCRKSDHSRIGAVRRSNSNSVGSGLAGYHGLALR